MQSNLRYSESEIWSDIIPAGKCDMVLSVEPLEAMRYRHYLRPGGWVVTSTTPFVNIPNYPESDGLLDRLAGIENIAELRASALEGLDVLADVLPEAYQSAAFVSNVVLTDEAHATARSITEAAQVEAEQHAAETGEGRTHDRHAETGITPEEFLDRDRHGETGRVVHHALGDELPAVQADLCGLLHDGIEHLLDFQKTLPLT